MSEDQRQVLSIGQIDEFRHLLSVTQRPVKISDDWDLQIDGAHEFARAIESATIEALAQQAQEPLGDRYFSYSTDMGFEEFATQQEAIDCSNVQINGYRDDAIRDDEWPDEVDSVCWGVILGRSKEIDTSNEDHESVDYKLYTTPPAPQVPAPVDELDAVNMAKARAVFESISKCSHNHQRSARGTYRNPPVARDWKWFQLGIYHATEGAK